MLQTLACILLSLAAFTQAQNAIGLNTSVAANACTTQCFFSNPEIWASGAVPGSTDAVTIQNTAAMNLVIDIVATVYQFNTDATNKYPVTITFNQGASLTALQDITIAYTTTVTIPSGSNLTAVGSSTVNGIVTVNGGNFTTGTTLEIDTTNVQGFSSPVYATVTLNGGYVTANGGTTVTSTANLIGSGTIVSSVSSSGTISMGTATKTGTLYIIGSLDTSLSGIKDSQIYVKVAGANDFDHLIMTGTFTQDGDLYIETINDFTPLNYETFVFANHSAQLNGFSTIRGTGLSGVFNNQWKVQVDQTYTALRYGSASSVAISFFLLAACALVSSL